MIQIMITPQGFRRDTLPEILDKLKTAAQGIFGQDIELGPETQDGQLLGIFAEAIDDTCQAVEDAYNSRNPNAATGQALATVCTLNGLAKILGGYSVVDVSATVALNATVPAGTQVRDSANGAVYAFNTPVTGTGGATTVTCTALEKGTTSTAGHVTEIVNPTFGLISVTNPNASTTVAAEETDEQLRIRRAQSTMTPSVAMVDSVLAAVLAVGGIGKVRIWENTLSVQQSAKPGDNALTPNCIAVVVSAGPASDIAAAIYSKKSLGCSTMGNIATQVSDARGNPQIIRHTVATPVRVVAAVTYQERVGQGFGSAGGEASVKAALAAWILANQYPGDDVFLSFLSSCAQQAVIGIDGQPAFVIESFTIGRYGGAQAAADLELAWGEIATLAFDDITMTVAT